MEGLATFGFGLFAWTLLEYAIHGWLSHIFSTFARPFHYQHHQDPHAVFAIRAWIPISLSWLGGLVLFGWAPGMIFYSGMVAGFSAYEAIHYRIHFSAPSSGLEAYLRLRHLIHHHCEPAAYFGVTSAVWDRIFGTELTGERMTTSLQTVAGLAPLAGASNLRRLLYFSR